MKKPVAENVAKYMPGDIGGRGRHPADPTGEIYGDHHWPLPQKHERGTSMKYMLIDTTVVEATKILVVATLRRVQLIGRLMQAQGRTVIAPPVEGRGFSKLEPLALQYLFWNTCGKTPPAVYEFLVNECLQVIETLPEDQTPIEDLEREVARLCPPPEASKTSEKGETPQPRSAGATGKVWVIADRIFAEKGNQIDRKAIIDACVAEGINSATAATQFAKWKNTKKGSTSV